MSIPTSLCPSCGHKKYSATKNPSGLCDECNGGRSKKAKPDAPAPEPEPVYWYQCQERAMAPGSGDGWPAIIRPQHSANARLVRQDGDPLEAITTMTRDLVAAYAAVATLTAEVAALRAGLETALNEINKANLRRSELDAVREAATRLNASLACGAKGDPADWYSGGLLESIYELRSALDFAALRGEA